MLRNKAGLIDLKGINGLYNWEKTYVLLGVMHLLSPSERIHQGSSHQRCSTYLLPVKDNSFGVGSR